MRKLPSRLSYAYKIFDSDILFLQRILKSEELYAGMLDADFGPQSFAACREWHDRAIALQKQFGHNSQRTHFNILGLTLRAQHVARMHLAQLEAAGYYAEIISGTRTFVQQNKLYSQGRYGNTGRIVTNAAGGKSNHNFGVAWDIGLFAARKGKYIVGDTAYIDAYQCLTGLELEWGGSWKTFFDPSHYQLKTALQIAEMETAFKQGDSVIV